MPGAAINFRMLFVPAESVGLDHSDGLHGDGLHAESRRHAVYFVGHDWLDIGGD